MNLTIASNRGLRFGWTPTARLLRWTNVVGISWLPQRLGSLCSQSEPISYNLILDHSAVDVGTYIYQMVAVISAYSLKAASPRNKQTKSIVAFMSLLNFIGIMMPETHRLIQLYIYLIIPVYINMAIESRRNYVDVTRFWRLVPSFAKKRLHWLDRVVESKRFVPYLEWLSMQGGYCRGIMLIFDISMRQEGYRLPFISIAINAVSTFLSMASLNILRTITGSKKFFYLQIITLVTAFIFSAFEMLPFVVELCYAQHSTFSFGMLIYRNFLTFVLFCIGIASSLGASSSSSRQSSIMTDGSKETNCS